MAAKSEGCSCTILGAGSWGTALAHLLAGKGYSVTLWGRDPAVAEAINATHHNPRYLTDLELPAAILATADPAVARREENLCVVAVPCAAVREVTEKIICAQPTAVLVISAAKGLEPETGKRPSEIILEANPRLSPEQIVALSGPNLAREMVAGVPTATVVASRSAAAARRAQEIFSRSDLLRVYTASDVIGVELGGALKNIIAVGAGISDGLGFGDNTKAALVTRGLAEMIRLGCALGAEAQTFAGLSGIGDLVVTCVSSKSRNWQVGYGLACGNRLADVLSQMQMVAEGVPTTRAAYRLARRAQVETPIVDAIHAVLFEAKNPAQAVSELMGRAPTREFG